MSEPSNALTRAAIEGAFETHEDELFGFFVLRTGCAATSEDLLQDTFLRALRYRRSFRGDGSVRAWLYQIARRLLVSRSERTRLELTRLTDDLRDPGPTPEDALNRNENRHRVRAGLAELAPAQAEVLILTRIQGMPYSEAAEILEITEGAVKVRVFRALAALRVILGPNATQPAQSAPPTGTSA